MRRPINGVTKFQISLLDSLTVRENMLLPLALDKLSVPVIEKTVG